MKRYFIGCVFTIAMVLNTSSYANWFADIVDRIEKTNAINSSILDSQNALLTAQRDMLSSEKDIESLMRQVNSSMIGNSGWGSYNFHDYQSYGSDAQKWSSVMQMASSGNGSGALGQVMSQVSSQFPIDTKLYNTAISDTASQKYFAIKSQTNVAARAASQLDYDKIQDQITYQQMLQQQIEKTKDLKAAIDLSNRIQVEGNLISLELLRQSSLSNQQQAISDQAIINSAFSNAKFLSK